MTKAEKTVVEVVRGLLESSVDARRKAMSPYGEGVADGYLFAAERLLMRLALRQLED